MPRALVLCLATALLSGAVPARAEDTKPPPAAPAAPAPAPAAPPAPAAAATPAAAAAPAADEEAGKRSEAANDRRSMFEARLAALHAGLLLTPEQEKMWPAVEAAIRDFAAMRTEQADARADRRQDADDEEDAMSGDDPVAALKEYSDSLLRRAQTLKAVADSAGPLWASMTEEQKRRLPRILRELNPHHPPHGPRAAERDDEDRREPRRPGSFRDEPRDHDGWQGSDRRGRMREDAEDDDGWRRRPHDPMDEEFGERR